MRIPQIVSKVNMTEDLWNESLEDHSIIPDEFDGITYYRVVKRTGQLRKGTVVTYSGIIYDFPRIARIMHLENGIKLAFGNSFYVEEKVDGYNVRIAKVQGKVFAFTRGSYVCPFSTDRLGDFFNYESFFTKNPELIVCGEIAGPENPYNGESPPYVTEDVSFFAFDIKEMNSEHQMPIEKRYEFFDRYGIPTVTRFGSYAPSDIIDLKRHIQGLNEKGCEGLVFKPIDPSGKTVKYVTVGSCLRDMKITSPLMIEYQAEFFTHRMLRSLFYLLENDLPLNDEFLKKTGEALLLPLFENLKKAAEGKMITERFKVRFNKEQNIKKLFEHFHKCKVDANLVRQDKVGRQWHVEIVRRCFPSYEVIRKHWDGSSHFD
ncbi:ATP-dependent DNA ligase, homolog of eukaryotic ligase III [Candidatus Scalindua japonica]|uniref:ATP-dependent DNA ligase, homolog of eukaryotic ligase III n=1 Tax=Candidatus Scalindua japonica TaxID=1284222 RepID=A0A286TY15_9BACT|nr:RNA ligase [Candidatus Scalindua japonica]GAX60767.1 ATP-dependent DNA ligase, homolog of eukaryotic ligase III [Candidatus Scalindua japonica]